MKKFITEQEEFWAGEFGNEYIHRNNEDWLLASNMSLFSSILKSTRNIKSLIEFGANIGMNIRALQVLLPKAELNAIEINEKAVDALKKLNTLTDIYHGSILDYKINKQHELVFTKGVLIHLNPDILDTVYKQMYDSSSKYICMIEYYNPSPLEITYRGHNDKMYKRDFAGEIMQKYSDLELLDYGFVYRNDPVFMQGDLTWFLMEKRS